MNRSSSVLIVLSGALLLSGGPGTALADRFEMKDGSVVDGKFLKEEAGTIWVKTFAETKKIAAADVAKRTPGESSVERYDKLKAAVEANPKDAEGLWELYRIGKENEAFVPKGEPGRYLQRLLKVAPEHAEAREANGEVRFDGKWVKREDLPRLQAEAEKERRRVAWQTKVGVTVELYDGDHFTLVDNSASKDPGKRVQEMDEAYRRICEVFGVERIWDGQADALAFKRFDDYRRYLDTYQESAKMPDWKYKPARDKNMGGFWRHMPVLFVMRFVTEDGEDGMWHAFVHNAAHMAVWKHWGGKAPPDWLNEGLGSWAEIQVMGVQKSFCVGITAKKAPPGGTSDKPKKPPVKPKEQGKLVSEYKERCIEAMRNEEFPAMRLFLKMQLGEYGPEEAGGALGLVTWLLQKDPEKFKELVKALKAGPAKEDEPWSKIYGWNVIEDMEKEFKGWVVGEW